MLSLLLLSVLTLASISTSADAWKTSWRPIFLPAKSGRNHQYGSLIPHAVIRTKIVVLEENIHKHEDSHSHSDEENHHDIHSPHDENDYRSYRYGFQKDEDNKREYHPYENFDDNQGYSSKHLGFKYSTPVALSPWKPIFGPSRGYWPLKYLGEDEELVKTVLQKAVKEVEPDPKPHLILPIGMQKLHNPPLKRPRVKHRNSIYGENKNLGVHYDDDDDVRILRKRRFRGKTRRRRKNYSPNY